MPGWAARLCGCTRRARTRSASSTLSCQSALNSSCRLRAGDPPKQEEEVGSTPERVAFEIEEDVSIIGFGNVQPVSTYRRPRGLEWRGLIGTFALTCSRAWVWIVASRSGRNPSTDSVRSESSASVWMPTASSAIRSPVCGYQRRTPVSPRRALRTCSQTHRTQ